MKRTSFVVMATCFLVSSGVLLAHHGGNLYDTTKAAVMKGTITKFEWGTPHNQIYYDVKTDKGEVQHWVGSTEPAGVMLEQGWTRRSLKPGDEVTIHIFAAKNGATVGNLQRVIFADGRELNAGFGGPRAGGACGAGGGEGQPRP
ncbi:MAG: DUF6152 family protein [Vicinamibacterales bacterium]